MDRNAAVFFYMKANSEPIAELCGALEKLLAPDRLEVCRSLEQLSARLRIPMVDPTIAVLAASDVHDLDKLFEAKPLFGTTRIILVLPDRSYETVALGHRLHPRFVSYKDGDWHEVVAVLEKMLKKAGASEGPRLPRQRTAESIKHSYHDRGYQMATEYRGLPHIKSLPPFIYSKKMQLKEADLNEIVGGIENGFLRHAAQVDFKKTLAREDLPVMADGARIGEALMHLIRNARDAMPSGGVLTIETKKVDAKSTPALHGGGELPRACALCSISDTGYGMDAETQMRVFEPFFTTKERESKGLGLPIARHIIGQHNGSMTLESRPGKGTTVNIYLPLLTAGPLKGKPIALRG